jgi:N-acetylneuraminate synthase
MIKFKINNSLISEFSNPFIIAEACDNHFGDINLAIKMIDAAKEAGADAIKFQHHLPDEEMLPIIPMSDNFDEPLYDFLKKNALKLDQHIKLKEYCDKIDILYLCTPFSYKAAEEINKLVPVFKIGSGEMTDLPSLEKISKLGKGMIISTGMSTFDEIDRTYNFITSKKIPLALMNCISEYPPLYEDLNLLVIKEMISRYPKALIGHSDHTSELYSSLAAITLGAKIIEKHVILDKKMKGPDQEVSIDFYELKKLVDGAKKINLSLGKEKKVHKKEKQIRQWAFRSLVSIKKIPKNKIIDQEDIWCKRPGTGIPSYLMNNVIGLRTLREIEKDQLIDWSDLEKK